MKCTTKRTFYTERDAIQARIELGARFNSQLRHYECDCGKWHLTSRLLWWQPGIEHDRHIEPDWLEA